MAAGRQWTTPLTIKSSCDHLASRSTPLRLFPVPIIIALILTKNVPPALGCRIVKGQAIKASGVRSIFGNKSGTRQLSDQSVINHGVHMTDKKQDLIDQNLQDLNNDGVDRRGFLKCMAWAGTGLVWTLSGGIPTSTLFGATGHEAHHSNNGFSFVQISDSHIGFNKGANPDVIGTFQAAINKINALPAVPDLIIHTGDLSQISKPGEFDTVGQVLKGAK